MKAVKIKSYRRTRRKRGIRKRLFGTAERPRLTVFRSLKHTYAQIIDDERGCTICAAGTNDKSLRAKIGYGGNAKAAKVVGETLAAMAKEKNIQSVCFDRNGFRYGGRLKSLADAMREQGIKF